MLIEQNDDITLLIASSYSSDHACVFCASDIDECQTGRADCAHGCRNTRGSFMCVCPAAYELGVDGKQCYREYDLSLSENISFKPFVSLCSLSFSILSFLYVILSYKELQHTTSLMW